MTVVLSIVVAAGSGVRMKSAVRKQYLRIGGDPVFIRTLAVFNACGAVDRALLAVPEPDMEFCRTVLSAYPELQGFCRIVAGGESRQASVYNGLKALEAKASKDDLVVIHDGVRPFVTPGQILQCIEAAEKDGASILGVPITETIKEVSAHSGTITKTLTRDGKWLAQTPQVFRYGPIWHAHQAARAEGVDGTDDAMLMERLGGKITIVPGSRMNIKITHPEDILFAEAMSGQNALRK